MAKPMSARLSAGESFIPSPVMPTTSSSSCDSRTSLLLSDGSARATTARRGRSAFALSSSRAASSALVITTVRSEFMIEHSRAIALAVSAASPVIITTPTPAPESSRTAFFAAGRSLSRR